MKKKIILLSSTLIIIFAGLFLYQRFINVGPSGTSAAPESTPQTFHDNSTDSKVDTVELPQNIGVGDTKRLIYVRTNKKGRIIQKFGFVERLESLPGKLKIKLPWIQIFSKDDRITEITAQTGTVDVEGAEGQMQIPNSGFLENVRIKMYRLPKDTAVIPIPLSGEIPKGQIVEMEVRISDTVRFEREISHLQSAGDCTVSSKLFGVEGTGLSLTYDQNNERLQDLELLQVKQLRLARKDLPSRGKLSPPKDSQPKKSTGEKKDPTRSKTAAYRFILSENVVIEQPTKNETLLADSIEVIADFDPNQYKPESREISPGQEERETNRNQLNREPAQEKKKDIYITCDGPLKIALAPEFEPTPLADRLQFTANGKPARIFRNGKLALEADTIEHDQTKQFSELSSDSVRPIRMSLSTRQWAAAQKKVTLDQKQNLASLFGPGQVEYITDPNAEPAKIQYQDELLVKFTDLADSLTDAKLKEPAYIKWISFKGPIEAQSKDGFVKARKKGKLDFYIPPTKQIPITTTDHKPKRDVGAGPIKYLELWGNVIARDQKSNIQVTDRLEADFEYIDPNTSRIRSVQAFGPLRAEDPNYIIQADDKLLLTFDTKDTVEIPPSAPAPTKTKKTPSAWGFDQLLGSANLLHAVAEGANGALRFTSKQDKYQVIGDRAVGGGPNQIWTITGQPAQVVGLAGQGQLQGNKITADLADKICRVTGQGNMDATMKGDLLGRESNRPMPMRFEWKNGVTYNLNIGKIIAEDVNARVESTEKTKQITYLQCPMVTVKFDPNSSTDRPDKLYAKLDMDTFLAHGGQVQLRRQEYDPNTNRLLNDLELLSQQLHFDNRTRIMRAPGPGLVEVTDYRPPQSQKQTPQDQSVNQALTQMFGASGPARTLLRFGRQMRFDKEPNELSFTGGVALDHLPLTSDLKPDPAQLANLPGLRKLDCRDLILILTDSNTNISKQTQSEQPAKFPDTFGAVQRVTALGRVFAEANFADGTRRFFAGEKLTYDNLSKVFVIEGTDAVPAYLGQMQFRTVTWNLETGRIDAVPLGQSILAGQF
jgi:hypothetical protein